MALGVVMLQPRSHGNEIIFINRLESYHQWHGAARARRDMEGVARG
jgi:hypothetical protein